MFLQYLGFLAAFLSQFSGFGSVFGAAIGLLPAVDDPGTTALVTMITGSLDAAKIVGAAAAVFAAIVAILLVVNVGPNWAIGKAKKFTSIFGGRK